jgi:N-acyl-D-amino-acid deacylase
MTGLTASTFGLHDRGRVAPGLAADLTLFDPETVLDRADYSHPTEPATGIEWVLVNGRPRWPAPSPWSPRSRRS